MLKEIMEYQKYEKREKVKDIEQEIAEAGMNMLLEMPYDNVKTLEEEEARLLEKEITSKEDVLTGMRAMAIMVAAAVIYGLDALERELDKNGEKIANEIAKRVAAQLENMEFNLEN